MAKWDEVSFSGENRVKISELIKIVDYRNNTKFRSYRFFGDLVPYAVQWLPIYKDGKPVKNQKGNEVRIPFNVTNFDPETGKYDTSATCPFVEAAEKMMEYIKDEKERNQLKPSTGFYAQAINRKLQDNPDKDGKPSKAERSTGFKESLDSDSFTPVEVHQLNYTIGQGLETARELNTHKDKKTGERVPRSVADPKYGCDIMIKYDPNAKGQGKYKVNKSDSSRLSEEELKYLTWDVIGAIKETTISRKEAKIEAKRLLDEFMKAHKNKKSRDDSPDIDAPEDIEDELDRKSSKKKSSSKKDSPDDSPSPNIDDSPADSPEDSPEEKKSSKKSSKKKDSPEDSPVDSPDDSPEEKKSSKKKSSKKDSPDDSPDDSPEEKKSSKKKSSSKKKDSPEEDDDDDSPDIDLDELAADED